MPAWILLFSLCLIGGAAYLLWKRRQERYHAFLRAHSPRLLALYRLNETCSFAFPNFLDQSHTYDNETYYNSVSCEDYLIYQLPFVKKELLGQIALTRENRRRYAAYRQACETLPPPGQFTAAPGRLNEKELRRQEAALFDRGRLPAPITRYHVTVTLLRSDLRGRVFEKKSALFDEEDLLRLLKRLAQKKGRFYTDRGIWDAICRVERGKVSNKMRFAVYARDHYRCRLCGASDRSGARLEVDHIFPIAKGGKTTFDNLQTLCHRCNVAKGDSLPSR